MCVGTTPFGEHKVPGGKKCVPPPAFGTKREFFEEGKNFGLFGKKIGSPGNKRGLFSGGL